jgi:hypothetical protein
VRELEAVAVVPAAPEAVFEFLTALENHWRVADRFVDVVSLEGAAGDGHAAGGVVRVTGPLGLRRTAATRVERAEPPALLVGTANIGPRTRARVSWSLASYGGGTLVRLAAVVERASRLDRALLALGGRAWLERRFASALAHLARHFGAREPAVSRGGPALAGAG